MVVHNLISMVTAISIWPTTLSLRLAFSGQRKVSCSAADYDSDGDVDLADYALLQIGIGETVTLDNVVAENLGVNVTRFYPEGVDLADLPPSMSMETVPHRAGRCAETVGGSSLFLPIG